MDLKDIRNLVELMDEHGLSHFRLEKEEFELELKKGTDVEAMKELLSAIPSTAGTAQIPYVQNPPAPISANPSTSLPPSPEEPALPVEGESINSPMVGTFYRKPSPDAPNFVNVGDTIMEGQTICIIEAMKVMNEIKAETSGTVLEIYFEEGTPVQFGDSLFRIS